MAYKHIGKDFTPPDLVAKVTGSARYAEDFRADGMAFVKILGSPMPHAKVNSIDLSKAEQMPGVLATLVPSDVKQPEEPGGMAILSSEPAYVGQPIVAIAAETEQLATDALAAIEVDLEPLPFCIDPLESLKPDGPNALTGGNVVGRGVDFQEIKRLNGRLVMLMQHLIRPPSSLKRPLYIPRMHIMRWSPGRQLRIGKTANATYGVQPNPLHSHSPDWPR